MSIKQDIYDARMLMKKLSYLYAQKIETQLASDQSCSQDVYALTKLIDSFSKLIAYEHKTFGEEGIEHQEEPKPETEEERRIAELYIKKMLEPEVIRITPKSRTGQDLFMENYDHQNHDIPLHEPSILNDTPPPPNLKNESLPPLDSSKGSFYSYDQKLRKFVEEKTDSKNIALK